MTDNDYIKLIKSNDNQAVSKLYNSLKKPVLSYLARYKNLLTDDKQDIFQDAIICLVTNARKEGFRLSSRLETFVIGIVKNLVSNRLRKSKKLTPIDAGEECFSVIDVVASDDDIEMTIEKNEKVSIAKTIIRQIGENCRNLLLSFYIEEKSYKEITEMGVYANEDSAKTAKNKCMTKIKSVASQINI